MRRRGAVGRRGPGLLGTMARTAVVAGTATAVSKSVSGSMNDSAMQKQQAQYGQQQAQQSQAELERLKAQMEAMQAQQVQQVVGSAGSGDLLGQIQQLGQMRETGVLTHEEFQVAKKKLLG